MSDTLLNITVQAMETQYENAILHALANCSPQQMGCKDATQALWEYMDEFDLTPLQLLRNFIEMCTPTEFENLRIICFDILDKKIGDL